MIINIVNEIGNEYLSKYIDAHHNEIIREFKLYIIDNKL